MSLTAAATLSIEKLWNHDLSGCGNWDHQMQVALALNLSGTLISMGLTPWPPRCDSGLTPKETDSAEANSPGVNALFRVP